MSHHYIIIIVGVSLSHLAQLMLGFYGCERKVALGFWMWKDGALGLVISLSCMNKASALDILAPCLHLNLHLGLLSLLLDPRLVLGFTGLASDLHNYARVY